jgi:hypothetical protein
LPTGAAGAGAAGGGSNGAGSELPAVAAAASGPTESKLGERASLGGAGGLATGLLPDPGNPVGFAGGGGGGREPLAAPSAGPAATSTAAGSGGVDGGFRVGDGAGAAAGAGGLPAGGAGRGGTGPDGGGGRTDGGGGRALGGALAGGGGLCARPNACSDMHESAADAPLPPHSPRYHHRQHRVWLTAVAARGEVGGVLRVHAGVGFTGWWA